MKSYYKRCKYNYFWNGSGNAVGRVLPPRLPQVTLRSHLISCRLRSSEGMAELGVAREACLGVATGPISPRSRSPTVPSAGVPKVAVGLEMSRHWQPF